MDRFWLTEEEILFLANLLDRVRITDSRDKTLKNDRERKMVRDLYDRFTILLIPEDKDQLH